MKRRTATTGRNADGAGLLWGAIREWFGRESSRGGVRREGGGLESPRPRAGRRPKPRVRQPGLFEATDAALGDTPAGTSAWPAAPPQTRVDGSAALAAVASPAMARRRPMRAVYDEMVAELLTRYEVRVRRWRSSTSGVAIVRKDAFGRWLVREIESPYPRGPMSAAVFLHEIGHHAIGVGSLRPRCLEEWAAWEWSLREMRRRGIRVTPAVETRVHDALHHALLKAKRRGLREVPAELAPYAQPRRRTATRGACA